MTLTSRGVCKMVKVIRKGLGLKDWEIAQKVGVNAVTFSKWKRGICLPRMVHRQALRKLRNRALKTYVVGAPSPVLPKVGAKDIDRELGAILASLVACIRKL